MSVIQFANGNLSTTALNSQLAGDTVVTPNGSSGFPTNPLFTILNRTTGELMLVTAVSTSWTISRGYASTAAQPITAGDVLDYNLTREMLLAGFQAKLDEVILTADSTAVQTLTVPSGLPFMRNLKLRIQASATTDAYLNWRFNNDSSALYDNNYGYSGSGTSSGQWLAQTYGRCWTGNPGALPAIGCDVSMEIGGADASDRNKSWVLNQWLWQSGGQKYIMNLSGLWRPSVQAAISTIQLSCDSAGNGTWNAGTLRAGFRASLYGTP